ncbi:alpha/beta hydrolase family protein [Galactobacter valiniphilus]|uniref:alpha/beta hydrolase family protein n=1 Tax=Galactobacter valiniphilus TaxID=2676122 RepID=UPI0037359B33
MTQRNDSPVPSSKRRKGPGPVAWTILGLGAGAAVGSAAAGVIGGLATLFAREVVTPGKAPVEDLEILALISTPRGQEVVLPVTQETTKPGTYSLWFDGDRGHARLGEVTERSDTEGTLQREVITVDRGDLGAARRGRLGGNVYLSPADLGLDFSEVQVPVSAGQAPAWLIPGSTRSDTWAIMIHGRGANRLEALRALPVAHDAGLTSLVVSYRNDGDAPEVNNGRYGLGTTEWRDVDSAIGYAISQGARDVVLFGWSMGGAIALQVADRSQHRTRVQALVLDGPAVNWFDILEHQAKINKIPYVSGRLGTWLLTHPWGKKITGLTAPLDLASLDWVSRAEQLRVPTLILHSKDDDFVPFASSAELAAKNPAKVDLVAFTQAGHVREWNVDPKAWDDAVSDWLESMFAAPIPGLAPLPR